MVGLVMVIVGGLIMKSALAMPLSLYPLRNARAFTVALLVIVKGLLYTVEAVLVGSLPSRV